MILRSIPIVLLTLALQPVFVDAQTFQESSSSKTRLQTILTTAVDGFLLFGKTTVDNFLIEKRIVASGTHRLVSVFSLDDVSIESIKNLQENKKENKPQPVLAKEVIRTKPEVEVAVKPEVKVAVKAPEPVSVPKVSEPIEKPIAAVFPSINSLLTRIKISGVQLLNKKTAVDTVDSEVADNPKETVTPVNKIISSTQNTQVVSAVMSVTDLEKRLKTLENRIGSLQMNVTRRNDAAADNVSRVVQSSSAGDNPSFVTGAFSSDLNVSGELTLSGGTTTAASGIDLSDGCFAIDGTCLSTGGSGGGITSLGPTGQGQTGSTLLIASSSNGSDFSVTGSGNTITWNFPTAGVSARGLLSAADWSNFNNKISSSSIDTSAELLGLVSDGTGSGSLVFATNPTLAGFLTTASSTLQNFTFVNATGSQATTTSLFSTSGRFTTVCLTGDTCRTTWPSTNVGSQWATSTNNLAIYQNAALAVVVGGTATTTIGAELEVQGDLYVSGSTTIQGLTFINATGSAATTTNFFSTTASSTNFFATNVNTGLMLIGRSTTTNATTTTIFSTTASSTSLFSTSLNTGLITSGTVNGQTISSATNFTGTVTATGGLTSLSNLLLSGSSTLLSFTGQSNTTTNATTTTMFSTTASSTNLFTTNLTTGAVTSGLINSQTISSAANFTGTLTATGGLTSLSNLLLSGSSTLLSFTGQNNTTTNATTTAHFSTTSSSTNMFFSVASGGAITSTGLGTFSNLLISGSSTLQNFTGLNNTTTNATTTTIFSTTASSTNLFATTIASVGNILSSGLGTFSNLLINGSSTLQNFTGLNNTTTNATTTSIFSTTESSTNLFTSNFTLGGSMTFQNKSTTTISAVANGWAIATSTATNATPLIAFNNNSSSSTISFFTATTTGLVTGSGVALPSALKQQIIIGNGRDQASVAIVNGSLCIDNDGWCQASSTAGRLTMLGEQITGADLAEAYTSLESLEAGELVSIMGGTNVSKADRQTRPSLMGVVSTDPGIVMGLNTNESIGGNKYAIALSGRVPVMVNTDNGAIEPGDYLTLSSASGVATKALKAGVVIGQALEEFNHSGVGKILVFVKNSYYSGISVEDLPGVSSMDAVPDSQAVLLSLMTNRLDPGSVSDITTDRLVAGVEIITPKLTADSIYANKIESPTLNFITYRLSKLEEAWQSSTVGQATMAVTDWVGNKVSAVLGVFDRVETKTVRVSQGLELIDSKSGEVYCVTIKDGEFSKTVGACNVETGASTVSASASSPVVTQEPEVISSSTEGNAPVEIPIENSASTESNVEPTTDISQTTPETPAETPVETSTTTVEPVEEVASPTRLTP